MFVSRDLFPSTYKKLKDSYWTVRLQTQAYMLITDARAAQKELAGITETESHQNWDKWGYGLPDHFPELDRVLVHPTGYGNSRFREQQLQIVFYSVTISTPV